MNLASIIAVLKGMIPILEPIGEQGVGQIFDMLDAEIAKISSPDLKEGLQIMSPALKQFVIAELKKLT